MRADPGRSVGESAVRVPIALLCLNGRRVLVGFQSLCRALYDWRRTLVRITVNSGRGTLSGQPALRNESVRSHGDFGVRVGARGFCVNGVVDSGVTAELCFTVRGAASRMIRGAGNLACAGSLTATSRLEAGCGQDCPHHNQ